MNNRVRYTRQNIISNTFYQLPKFLFDDEFSGLSNDARVLYALLRNRHEMSIKNGWYDEKDEVYIYFKREAMQSILGLSDKPITKAMKALKTLGLLEEVQQGLGKPNRIYLLAVKTVEIHRHGDSPIQESSGTLHGIGESAVYTGYSEKAEASQTRTFSVSGNGNCPTLDTENLRPNHKEISQNKEIHNNAIISVLSSPVQSEPKPGRQDTDTTEPQRPQFSMLSRAEEDALIESRINGYTLLVKENIGYSDLAQSRPYEMQLVDEFVAIIIDTVFTDGKTVRIGREDKPRELVKSQLLKLNYSDIEHAIDQFKGVTERITKKKQYILTMLYNCKMEMDSHYTNAYNADRWQ